MGAGVEMWNEDKSRLLASGSTQHALVNRAGRPVAVPDWFKALFYLQADTPEPQA